MEGKYLFQEKINENLHLTLKKKWFDLIISGTKNIEFRGIKPYWEKRLLDQDIEGHGVPLKFDEIHFIVGKTDNRECTANNICEGE